MMLLYALNLLVDLFSELVQRLIHTISKRLPWWGKPMLFITIFGLSTIVGGMQFLGYRVENRTGTQFFYAVLVIVMFSIFQILGSRVLLKKKSFSLVSIAFYLCYTVITMADVIFGYAGVFDNTGIVASDPTIHPDRMDCLYFSGVTWTTIGYGDFTPRRGLSRLVAVLEALNAYIFLGVFIAVLTYMVSNLEETVGREKSNG